MERSNITFAGRAGHQAVQLLRAGGQRLLGEVWDPAKLGWAERVPVLPEWARRNHRPQVWARPRRDTPADLRTVPGVPRDEVEEDKAFAKGPLHFFFGVHPEATKDFVSHGWEYLLPTAPRYSRGLAALKRVRRASRAMPAGGGEFAASTPARRSAAIRAERAAFFAYAETMKRVAALAEFAQSRGAVAQPHGPIGEALVIPYAVRAGLGQLGLNGQLLTPAAGSHVRVCLITTDQELEHDEPVDYGIPAICDECQICARRCPVGAIPIKRAEHRGIVKAKIKTERCFPVVARVEGCAVCMKTCPVQAYGLDAVLEHRERTGEILGKGSDGLEGYHWPPDGRHYGPGEKPRVTGELIQPKGWQLDVTRTAPPPREPSTTA